MGSDTGVGQMPTKHHQRTPSFGQLELGRILSAELTSVECVRDPGKAMSYAVYKIFVCSRDPRGYGHSYTIVRRYSDFYALQDKVSKLFPDLGKLQFPSKKTFGNLDRQLLERRKKMLHEYLQVSFTHCEIEIVTKIRLI